MNRLLPFLALLAGCGYETPLPSTPAEVTGRVAGTVKDAYLIFHPVGGAAQPAAVKLGAEGKFQATLTAGQYTWYLGVPETAGKTDRARAEKALKAVPAPFQQPSMDRRVDVAPGTVLDLAVR
jgi:hypothetical protein